MLIDTSQLTDMLCLQWVTRVQYFEDISQTAYILNMSILIDIYIHHDMKVLVIIPIQPFYLQYL